jgi:hypothetical protein
MPSHVMEELTIPDLDKQKLPLHLRQREFLCLLTGLFIRLPLVDCEQD